MSVMDVVYGADEAYIRMGKGPVTASREVAPGLVLDVDRNGDAVGLEVLGLARRGLSAGRVTVAVEDAVAARPSEDERRLGRALFGADADTGGA